jgi:hypothetical protein
MKIQTQPDVIPGSIWCGNDREKFIVRGIVAQDGDVWVQYERMGTQQTYSCLVEAFQQRFTLYVNYNYEGSKWKL